MAALDIECHDVLVRVSRNEMLQRLISETHRWVKRFNTTTFSHPGRALEPASDHEQVLDALRRHSPDEADR